MGKSWNQRRYDKWKWAGGWNVENTTVFRFPTSCVLVAF